MSHLYKASEWESCGRYYINDTTELAGKAGLWYTPARMMGISPAAYIEWLITNYKPDHISFDKILIFSWDNLTAARKYKNAINKIARERNFIV